MLKKIFILLSLVALLLIGTYVFKGVSIKNQGQMGEEVTPNEEKEEAYTLFGKYSTYDVIKSSSETITCSALTVLEGDQGNISRYIKMVKEGNTVNRLDKDGHLILTINPNELASGAEVMTNSDYIFSLTVKNRPFLGGDAGDCHSFVKLNSFKDFRKTPDYAVFSSGNNVFLIDKNQNIRKIDDLDQKNIKEIHINNFLVLSNDSQVYVSTFPYEKGKLVTTITDPAKLRLINDIQPGITTFIDDQKIYSLSGDSFLGLSITSPVVLPFSLYVKGSDKVYYDSMLIPQANLNAFKLMETKYSIYGDVSFNPGRFYAKDDRNVYYKGKLVSGADVASFDVYKSRYYEQYAFDVSKVYFEGELVRGANPKELIILADQPYEGCSLGRYSKDTVAVYYKTAKVEGADPKTFEALINGYGKDANHSFLEGKIIPGNPKDLKVQCDYGL
ncbi:MAG: hypothetical protein RLY66_341 [Candidatus Parcubacteria bacterium]|jgi:ribosomal protein L21